MKYILLLTLFLSGCYHKSKVDKEFEELNQTIKASRTQLRIIDCQIGILFAINYFHKQLYQKITREQLDAAFQKCEESIK